MTLNEEKVLRAKIKSMIRESLFDSGYNMFEKESPEKSNKSKDNKGKTSNSSLKKRQRVLQALKADEVDVAQYAYKLWPNKDEDTCRSYFYKCLDGKEDDNGNPYKFSDEEINRLYSMLSNKSI